MEEVAVNPSSSCQNTKNKGTNMYMKTYLDVAANCPRPISVFKVPFRSACMGFSFCRNTGRRGLLLGHTSEPSANQAYSKYHYESHHCYGHSGGKLDEEG